ncbi:MAG: hypothetical protein R2939_07190 [Kofleriaceae bacterium]
MTAGLRIVALVGAALVAGCGGRAPTGPSPVLLTARALASGSEPGTLVVLYRDGAWVHVRQRAVLPAGRSQVAVPVPAGLGVTDITVVSTGDAILVASSRAAAPAVAAADRVDPAEERRGEAVLAPVPVVVDAPAVPAGPTAPVAAAPVLLTLERAAAGEVLLEVAFWTQALPWSVGYALLRDGDWGRLDGAVVIRVGDDVDLGDVELRLVDAPAARLADDDEPRRGDAVGVGAPAAARPVAPLSFGPGVPLRAGEVRVPLAASGQVVPLRASALVDVVGPRLDVSAMVPKSDRSYGQVGLPTPTIARTFELTLPEALVSAGVPDGELVFTELQHGQVVPRARAALRIADQVVVAATAPPPNRRTIVVADAPELEVERKQTDFNRDGAAKRLLEEITITLRNRGDGAIDAVVREHAYRGLTWTLAYQPSNAKVEQEGPQQFAMRVRVPARGEATLTYRVEYNW